MLRQTSIILVLMAVFLGIIAGCGQSTPATSASRVKPSDFVQAAPEGFGDRENRMAWSMQWWRGYLYVGTARSYTCFERAIHAVYDPKIKYPPLDTEMGCPPSPQDMELQAEIWRWSPTTAAWERVYQSPNDVPIPGHSGKRVARDIGFRDMIIFREPDGTEAMYVAGFSSRDFNPGVPLPRILRSTDGVTFRPIPQDRGTFLGDLDTEDGVTISGFNRLLAYKGHLYVTAGGAFGKGILLEAANPKHGNNAFRTVTPPGMLITELNTFNDQLYVAQGSNPLPDEPPFKLLRTNATGEPPYKFKVVVPEGGYRPKPSKAIASLFVFKGKLWAGTNQPAELLAINPDDSWDLVVGKGRMTPDGWKYPLSGMSDGFDWFLNVHIHRMQEHAGVLYLATNDQSNNATWRNVRIIDRILSPHYGFDLYATTNGWYFYPITTTGFEAGSFDFTGRTFASTPYGLFTGTGNSHYGLKIWRKQQRAGEQSLLSASTITTNIVYLPLMAGGDASTADIGAEQVDRLEAEQTASGTLLSWMRPPGSQRFHIFRSDAIQIELPIEDASANGDVPGPFIEIGVTDQDVFADSTVRADRRYHYYVVAENQYGTLAAPSNLASVPTLAVPASFTSLKLQIGGWAEHSQMTMQGFQAVVLPTLAEAHALVEANDLDGAMQRLTYMQRTLARQPDLLDPWRVQDMEILVSKLIQRIRMVQRGLLVAADVN
jgi:hypothetical protein